jgi:Bacterial regulatory helix-turn-helix proteins, AraC family
MMPKPLVLGTATALRLMAAVFRPGGGFPFAGCPAGELQNLQVPLSAFWPSETADLREHLCEAPTNGRVLLRIEKAADVDWADLAVSTGYFDQPHFIGDFRQFAGVTPSAYLRHRTSPNHVRIPD